MIIRWSRKGLVAGAIAATFVTASAVAPATYIHKYQPFPSFKHEFRHITPVAAVIPPVIEEEPGLGGGHKFEVIPRRIWIKPRLEEPALRLKDIEPTRAKEILEKPTKVTIEGEVYLVSEGIQPTPAAALKLLPIEELKEKIELVQKEFEVTKVKARKILEKIAEKEMLASEEVKMQLMIEDEELALIIIMSEV